jgi:hypothetical protein
MCEISQNEFEKVLHDMYIEKQNENRALYDKLILKSLENGLD